MLCACLQVNAARVADYIVSQQAQQGVQHAQQHGRQAQQGAGPQADAQFLVVSHKPQVGGPGAAVQECSSS